jgi:hypothetical protein
MKKILHYLLAAFLVVISINSSNAQSELAPDQNPAYAASRAKYMKMADSINEWHSTTPQETYRAIDYFEDKRIAREDRIAFRRELRLERARNGYSWGYDSYNNGSYYQPYYNFPSYNNYGYNRYGGHRNYRNSFTWNVLPWALAAGLWWR